MSAQRIALTIVLFPLVPLIFLARNVWQLLALIAAVAWDVAGDCLPKEQR